MPGKRRAASKETFNLDTLALTQEELDVLNTYTEADTYVFASEFILAKRGNEMGRTIGRLLQPPFSLGCWTSSISSRQR